MDPQTPEEVDEELSFDYNDDDAFDESDDDSEVETWQDSEDEDEQRAAQEQQQTRQSSSSMTYPLLIAVFGVLLVALLPVWFQSPNEQSLESSTLSKSSCLAKGDRLYTKSELAKYTEKPKILLAFLGVVYDVTEGSYYQPGGSYHFFSGKDGTRGFLTGEFTANELVDDITDLEDSYLSGLDTWLGLYEEKYVRVGVLRGAYYDQKGCETDKLRLVRKKIQRAKNAEQEDNSEQQKYPPCNSEWKASEKRGRVWCTKLSGGITRDWIGQPRLLYSLKSKNWRCACVQNDQAIESDLWCDATQGDQQTGDSQKKSGVKYAEKQDGVDTPNTPNCVFKHYPNCDSQAAECPISD